LLVFATVFTGFFHCPGKNSFCHGKNPTLPNSQHNPRLPTKTMPEKTINGKRMAQQVFYQ